MTGSDADRDYWERRARKYDRSVRLLGRQLPRLLHLVPDFDGAIGAPRRVLKATGRLVVPRFCHDETLTSRLTARVLAITGFPHQRRFTAGSLRQALERAAVQITRSELLPGVIPIGYVEGTFE